MKGLKRLLGGGGDVLGDDDKCAAGVEYPSGRGGDIAGRSPYRICIDSKRRKGHHKIGVT